MRWHAGHGAIPTHDDDNRDCFRIVEIEDSSRLRIKSPAVYQYEHGADLEKIPVDRLDIWGDGKRTRSMDGLSALFERRPG